MSGGPMPMRLYLAHGVVAHEADGAAGKAREARDSLPGPRLPALLTQRRRTPSWSTHSTPCGAPSPAYAPGGTMEQGATAAGLDHRVRLLAQKRVPREPFAALHAFQEEPERAFFAQREERANGREQVRGAAATRPARPAGGLWRRPRGGAQRRSSRRRRTSRAGGHGGAYKKSPLRGRGLSVGSRTPSGVPGQSARRRSGVPPGVQARSVSVVMSPKLRALAEQGQRASGAQTRRQRLGRGSRFLGARGDLWNGHPYGPAFA